MQIRFAKLATVYFFYFSILGVYIPYWPLYLKDLGFATSDIGELMAITLGTKIIAPYIWGWIGDHTHKRLYIIRLAAFLSVAPFFIMFFSTTYAWIALATILFSFFWNALLPQFEVLTLDSLKHQSHHYSRIRLWGSIGFITTAVGTAPLVNFFESAIVPWVVAATLTLLWLSSLLLSAPPQMRSKPLTVHLYNSLDFPIIALLMVSCLLQISHGPYYAYFTIFMEEHGYSRALIGQLWGIGVVCEIVMLVFASKLLKQANIAVLLILVALVTALRWLLIAFLPDYLIAIIFAQSLHAISFGVYHATIMHALSIHLPTGLKGRGQALYSSLSFGVGGSLGTYIASVFWEDIGGTMIFTLSAAVGILSLAFLIPLQQVYARKT